MLIWCVTLFCLGVIAFMDSFFNYGDIFRRVNSVVFMLLSLGLLIRTSIMLKQSSKAKQQGNDNNNPAKSDPSPASDRQMAEVAN